MSNQQSAISNQLETVKLAKTFADCWLLMADCLVIDTQDVE